MPGAVCGLYLNPAGRSGSGDIDRTRTDRGEGGLMDCANGTRASLMLGNIPW